MKRSAANVDLFAVAAIVIALGFGSAVQQMPRFSETKIDRVVRIKRAVLERKLQEAEKKASQAHRRLRFIGYERP